MERKKDNDGFLKKSPKVFEPPPPRNVVTNRWPDSSPPGRVGLDLPRAHTKGGGKTPLRAGAVSPGPLKILTIQFPETVGSRRHFDALTRLSTVGRNLADIFNPDHGYPPIRVLSMDTTRVMRNAQPGGKETQKVCLSTLTRGRATFARVAKSSPAPTPMRVGGGWGSETGKNCTGGPT